VSLIGTFIVLKAIGYSANTVSLLTVVLAIGIVVDDAIVVVENVERVMEENPELSPGATKRAMAEITAPIIAITLVLLSVFVPIAFIPGISGELFRQFAVTVSVSFSCNRFVPSASCGRSSRSRLRPSESSHALMIPGPVPPPIRILHQGGCHPEPGRNRPPQPKIWERELDGEVDARRSSRCGRRISRRNEAEDSATWQIRARP
jgi:AcrB/AcrD/AcrF family